MVNLNLILPCSHRKKHKFGVFSTEQKYLSMTEFLKEQQYFFQKHEYFV